MSKRGQELQFFLRVMGSWSGRRPALLSSRRRTVEFARQANPRRASVDNAEDEGRFPFLVSNQLAEQWRCDVVIDRAEIAVIRDVDGVAAETKLVRAAFVHGARRVPRACQGRRVDRSWRAKQIQRFRAALNPAKSGARLVARMSKA